MTTEEIKTDLQSKIDSIKEYDMPMDSISWGYEEGVIITGDQAQFIIDLLASKDKYIDELKEKIHNIELINQVEGYIGEQKEKIKTLEAEISALKDEIFIYRQNPKI